MNKAPPGAAPMECPGVCSPTSSAADLNQECFCIAVDPPTLHRELEVLLAAQGLSGKLADTHANLFSALPVYVSRQHIEQVRHIVAAAEEVTALPAYQSAVLAWAPGIANFDPGSPGGLLGFDFHLGPDGPRLIEINTNPGGVLLNALLGHAQRACMPDLVVAPTDAWRVEAAVMDTILSEWARDKSAPRSGLIVIVDDSPEQQFLYPEFLLYQKLFERNGYRSEICAPEALVFDQGRLWLGEEPVDFIYNRLTDFSLQETTHQALRAAYLAGAVALSPHPRAHALYADKRNLAVLGDPEFLRSSGASQASIDALVAGVPRTRWVTPENREAMWTDRGKLFFKPAAGFGSKASYRGDKLTRRVWDEIAGGNYVAQDIVPPSERRLAQGAAPLKLDIRCYAYRGNVLLFAARMYQGQTTNFRTTGGGFAPVLMEGAASQA